MSKEKVVLSIVVCTRNRSEVLVNCLDSLSKQTSNCRKEVQVIIINNQSSDDTVKVSKRYINSNWKLFNEGQLGLSFARNKGWQIAKGKYVAYIDDDAIADPDWVSNVLSFIKNNPRVKAFGGPYSYYTLNRPLAWFPVKEFILSHGQKERKLSTQKGEFLSGTNMIYTKALLQKMNGFNVDLGMSGKKIGYGEETELQKKINARDVPIHYIPSIKVKHLIAEHKQNLSWLMKDAFSRGISQSMFERLSLPIVVYSLSINIVKSVYLLVVPTKGNNQFWQRRIYYSLRPLLTEIGFIWGKISQ